MFLRDRSRADGRSSYVLRASPPEGASHFTVLSLLQLLASSISSCDGSVVQSLAVDVRSDAMRNHLAWKVNQ